MQEVLNSIGEKIGVSPETVQKSVAVLLQFARKKVDPAHFAKLSEQFPEISTLLSEPTPENMAGKASGLLGGFSALLGGQAADAMQAYADLQAAGLNGSQIPAFLQAFLTEARKLAGDETVDAVLKSMPLLQTFLGGAH